MDHKGNNSSNDSLTKPVCLYPKNMGYIKELKSLHGVFELYKNPDFESTYSKWEDWVTAARDNIIYDFDPIVKILSIAAYYNEQKIKRIFKNVGTNVDMHINSEPMSKITIHIPIAGLIFAICFAIIIGLIRLGLALPLLCFWLFFPIIAWLVLIAVILLIEGISLLIIRRLYDNESKGAD